MNIVEALEHEQLFRKAFEPIESWSAWTVILKAAEGLVLSPEERATLSAWA